MDHAITDNKLPGKPWLLPAAVVVVAGMVVYAGSFSAPFVFDGKLRIVENPAIRHLWPPSGWLGYDRRPVAYFSFALNYAVDGLDVRGYHAVNLAIHLAAAMVLFGVVRRALCCGRLAQRYGEVASRLAFCVALLWTVHPLQTQSVTYVVQRIESLMGLFFLLTLYGFQRAQDANPTARGSRRLVRSDRIHAVCATSGPDESGHYEPWWYAGSIGCCALGVATKEVAAMAPLVVLWYDRVFAAGSWSELWNRRKTYYLGLFATWGLIGYLMISRWKTYGGFAGTVEGISPLEYALSQPGVLAHYLRLSFWPVGQCLDYAWPVARTAGEIVLPLILIAGLLAITLWCMRRSPAWGFVGGWFFLILAPTSSVVPIRDLAFEHRMYLPLAAVVVTVVMGGHALFRRASAGRLAPSAQKAFGLVMLAVAVVLLGRLTILRNEVYRSEISVWKNVLLRAPHNPRAHTNLGVALENVGRLDEAIAYHRKALEMDPQLAQAHYNWGAALQKMARFDEAAGHFETAIDMEPRFVAAYYNLGVGLQAQGKFDRAIVRYEQALEIEPAYSPAHNNLGNVLDELGRFDEALRHYRKAVRFAPHDPQPHNNLGVFLIVRRGDREGAVRHFREALQLDPGFADAKQNLRRALGERTN